MEYTKLLKESDPIKLAQGVLELMNDDWTYQENEFTPMVKTIILKIILGKPVSENQIYALKRHIVGQCINFK